MKSTTEAITYLLTNYLDGVEYKPGQDTDMDKIINLLDIDFNHDDVGELYWFYDAD